VFYTTFRCDSRCRACNVWRGNDIQKKEVELTLEQVDKIFSDPLFANLEHINFQGGEATLRDDLIELVQTTIRRVGTLKRISLTSNGLDSDRVPQMVEKLWHCCRDHGLHFGLSLSIDGVGEYHDYARGKDAFKKVTRTLSQLDHMRGRDGFSLGTNCVLTTHNIDNIDEILEFQKNTFNTTNLTVVEFREHFLNTKDTANAEKLLFSMDENAKKKLIHFLEKHNRPKNLGDIMAYRYEQLLSMISENKPRTQACQYRINGMVLDHRGGLMLCPIGGHLGSCLENEPSQLYWNQRTKKVRNEMMGKSCLNCYPYNFYPSELAMDLVPYLIWYLKTRN